MHTTSISTSVEIGLRFIGIWPDLSHGNVSWFTYMISVVVALYFQYTYIFDHFDASNFSNLIDALSITLSYSLGFLKLIFFWSNRRTFYNMLLAMNKDWSEVISRDRLCIMTSNADLSRRCANVLFSINATAAISYGISGLIWNSVDFNEDLNVSSRALPIKMELPFRVEASPFFELLAVGQIFHEVSVAVLAAMMNSLIIALVLHVSGQIDILCRDLMIDNGESQHCGSIVTGIKYLIIKHQRIITFSNNIEGLYSSIALMQLLSNTLVICCIGFMIVVSLSNSGVSIALIKSVVFYIAVTLEAFIFCFAGEYLSAKSKSIGDAAYKTHWYNMTPDKGRIFLFLIARSQKRLTITAGNVMDLSLEGFTTVMKASASYISVLHAMY